MFVNVCGGCRSFVFSILLRLVRLSFVVISGHFYFVGYVCVVCYVSLEGKCDS